MKKDKKILCLIDALGSGGAERQIVGLAGLLKDKGYEVFLGCYYCQPMFESYVSFLREKGVPLVIELPRRKGFASKVMAIRRMIKKYSIDVVIAHKEQCNVKAIFASFFTSNLKVIVSQRNTYSHNSISNIICANLYRFADFVVPNSYSQTENITRNFPFLLKKVVTITNFVDTERFVPNNVIKNSGKLRILTIARINIEQKNAECYLKAIKLLKDNGLDFRADWYGEPYSNEVMERLERDIDKFDIRDVFSFHEPMANVLGLYQKADLFCLPSFYEGFPNVICEAMSCALPIVCGNVCDNAMLVEDEINGFLFDPNHPEDIANKIMRFSELPQENKIDSSANSRNLAIKKCSAEKFIQKYINLIEK